MEGEGPYVERVGSAVDREGPDVEREGAAVEREGPAVEREGPDVEREGPAVVVLPSVSGAGKLGQGSSCERCWLKLCTYTRARCFLSCGSGAHICMVVLIFALKASDL